MRKRTENEYKTLILTLYSLIDAYEFALEVQKPEENSKALFDETLERLEHARKMAAHHLLSLDQN